MKGFALSWLLVYLAFALLPDPPENPMLKKVTPILYVDTIEDVLPFWEDRLGFTRTAEVPQGDRLGFVILEKDGVEVMYQTRASVSADIPALADTPMRGSILFIEVEALEPVLKAPHGIEPVVPRRQTFYGADDVFVREPAGNVIGFVAFENASE